jgi:large subunit ribosomal protein L22
MSTSVDVIAKSDALPVSPRKLNLVAKMIRGMNVFDALRALSFCKKTAAEYVYKTVNSAVANADVNVSDINRDYLVVREAYVGKAVTLRRTRCRAKGSGSRILRKFSRLTVVLCESEV